MSESFLIDTNHKVIIIQAIEHISLHGNIHNRCIKDDVLLKLLQLPPDINVQLFNRIVTMLFPFCVYGVIILLF